MKRHRKGTTGTAHTISRSPLFVLAVLAVMAPLDDVAKAAVRAEFARPHGKYSLLDGVQSALVTYFAGRGESATELGLDVDRDDEKSWEAVWRSTLEEAKVESKRDQATFFAWARARCPAPGSGSGTAAGTGDATASQMQRLLKKVEGSGVVVPAATWAQLEKEYNSDQQGEEKRQCCCAISP